MKKANGVSEMQKRVNKDKRIRDMVQWLSERSANMWNANRGLSPYPATIACDWRWMYDGMRYRALCAAVKQAKKLDAIASKYPSCENQ